MKCHDISRPETESNLWLVTEFGFVRHSQLFPKEESVWDEERVRAKECLREAPDMLDQTKNNVQQFFFSILLF